MRSAATTLTSEYGLGSERVDELPATVVSVTKSEIWKRAQDATRFFSELPFETSSRNVSGKLTIIRGVFYLSFDEPDGWGIVDYKTDDLTAAGIQNAAST